MNAPEEPMPRRLLALRRWMLLPLAGTLACSVVAQAAELTFDLKIEHGRVPQNMRLIRVKQGDVVKLHWSTDLPLTLHLHGYDIEQMVKEMQSAVSAGVMGMDKFSEEVRRGMQEVQQVGTQLSQIIQQVQTLAPRFETVNEGMQAQATGAQQISEALSQLSEAAQQTVESLRQSNLGIEELRSRARRKRYEQGAAQRDGSVDPRTPLEEGLNAERSARVWSVLAALKTWQARILVLRSCGLSYAELAQVMRMKPGSVGTMLARAEAQFRKRYIQMYGAEE